MAGGKDDARRDHEAAAARETSIAEIALDLAHGGIGMDGRVQHAGTPVGRADYCIVEIVGKPIEAEIGVLA